MALKLRGSFDETESMPATTVASGVIKDAILLACRAPSLHNSQPWRWLADGEVVHLFVDPKRVVYSADRRGRQAIISCGAVLDHFRVAMAAAGWKTHVERYPDPNNRHHVASVDFIPADVVTDADRRRADAILIRRTDRLPMAAPPDWEALLSILLAAVDDDAVHLDAVDDDARALLAEASQLTEALRLYDSRYHDEISWWTAPFAATEGIPHSSLVSDTETERVGVRRTFPVIPHSERRPGIHEDCSRVVVLSTDGDIRDDALRSGEMLSRVVLAATTAGMATCPITHLTEMTASRHIVADLIDRAWPQILVRIGAIPSIEEWPPATPRRPLGDVLEFRSAGF
jgi:nitroreductase